MDNNSKQFEMTDVDYISERVDKHIIFFQKKVQQAEKQPFQILIYVTLLASFFVLLLLLSDQNRIKILILCLVTFIGIVFLYLRIRKKNKELSQYYTSLVTTLKSEKSEYLEKVNDYSNEDAFPKFVSKIEMILNSELKYLKRKFL